MNEKLLIVKGGITAFLAAAAAFIGWKGVLVMIWVLAMVLDYISGTAVAWKNHEWKSSVAKNGLWHKAGMVLAVMVAILLDLVLVVACGQIPGMGISWPVLLLPISCAWYIITELGSILENVVKLGAKVPAWLIKLLKITLNMVDKAAEDLGSNAELPDTVANEEVE